jgi:hypothetical protein
VFIGRFQLGQIVPLLLVTKNAAGTPTVPNAPPTIKVWAPNGTEVLGAAIPMIDRYVQTGIFQGRVFLSALFAAGLYVVTYYYQVGSYQGLATDNFEIMPGGDPDGNVMAMYFYRQPQADFIVQSLDSGKIVQGRNPTF